MKATILTTWLAISFLCCSCKSQDSDIPNPPQGNDAREPATETRQEAKPGRDRNPAQIKCNSTSASANTQINKTNSQLKTLLEEMLNEGMMKKAKNRYLASIKQSPQAAFSAYGTIADHIKKRGANANFELAEWSGALVQSDLPALLKKRAAIQRNEALIAAGRFHGVLDSVSEHISALPSEQFQQVMEELYSRLLKNKNEKLLDRLNTHCTRQLPNHVGLKELRIYIDTLITVKENSASAAKTLANNFGVLSDHYLSKTAKVVLQNADKENETNIIKKTTDLIFSKPGDIPRTTATAATYWLKLSEENEDASEMVEKLQILLKTNMGSQRIVWLLRKSVYTVLSLEDTEAINKLIKLGQQLLTEIESENLANRLRWLLFDMYCFIEDFDPALALLDHVQEAPNQEISVLRNKIRAHQAMEEGNWDNAIAGFRNFMEEVKKIHKDQQDLVTGKIIPYQSILGLNAKRIGDLYMKQDKKDKALAAYKEAIQHYTDALNKISPKNSQRQEIQKTLADLEKLTK